MLNEERIKIMTRTAAYEEHEGKKNMAIGAYFRADYLELHMIGSLFYGTLAFLVVAGMVLYYKFETILQDIYRIDLLQFGKGILKYYVAFLAVNAVVTYIVYAVRYSRAKKSLKHYYNNLKKLSSLYAKEGKK